MASLALILGSCLVRRALRCLEALAAGHTERAAIAAMPALPQQESEPAAVDPVTALDSSIEALYGPPGLPPPGMPGKIADSLAAEQPNFLSMRKAGTLSRPCPQCFFKSVDLTATARSGSCCVRKLGVSDGDDQRNSFQKVRFQ